MSFETNNGSKESVQLNRFDNLLDKIVLGEDLGGGSFELPKKSLSIGDEFVPVSFYAFSPKPLNYEFGASYSPSIYIEVGEYSIDEDGKPTGEVESIYLKRSNIAIQKTDNEKKLRDVDDELERAEDLLFAYQNYTPL